MTTGGAVQFHNFVASDNDVAGISGKETHLSTYGVVNSQAFIRNIIIGRTMAHPLLESCGWRTKNLTAMEELCDPQNSS